MRPGSFDRVALNPLLDRIAPTLNGKIDRKVVPSPDQSLVHAEKKYTGRRKFSCVKSLDSSSVRAEE